MKETIPSMFSGRQSSKSSEQAIDEARHQEIARCLFRESNDAFFMFDAEDHRVLDVNPAAQRLSGVSKKQLCRRKVTDLFDSEFSGGVARLIDAYQVTGFFHSREGYWLKRDAGEPIPVNISISRMHTQPRPLGLAVVRDVSERKRVERTLRESESRYRLLFDSNPVPMFVYELTTARFLAVNEAAARHYGYALDEFSKMTATDLAAEGSEATAVPAIEVGAAIVEEFVPPRRLETRHRKSDGTVFEVELTSHRIWSHGKEAGLALAVDVTERKRLERRLAYRAAHDPLTGLANRATIGERLERLAAEQAENGGTFALLMIDLDRFKTINDTLGHQQGDAALREVSTRFRERLRTEDLLARVGGDEFAVLLPGGDKAEAIAVAGRLNNALREPFRLEGLEFSVGASIGLAVFPEDATCLAELSRIADESMYVFQARQAQVAPADFAGRADRYRIGLNGLRSQGPARHSRGERRDSKKRRRQLRSRHEFLHFEHLNLASNHARATMPFEPIRHERG